MGLFVGACDEDELVSNDPTIAVVFYNIDSLLVVQSTLVDLSDSLLKLEDTLMYFSDSADIVTDNVLEVSLKITDGEVSLEPLLEELQTELFRLNELYSTFESIETIYSDSVAFLTAVSTSINNGEVVVSRITNRNNDKFITFSQDTDTADVWHLPLDMNSDISNLQLVLDEEIFELNLEYSRLIKTNEFGEVTIEVFGFSEEKITSTFDSLELNCETRECLDGEVSISVYF